jgi:hypothetical protein
MHGTVWTAVERPNERTGVGAKNHCAHGKNEVASETIVDWKPFDYFTTHQTDATAMLLRMTYNLEPLEGGRRTRLTVPVRLDLPRLPRLVVRQISRLMLGAKMKNMTLALQKLLAEPAPPPAANSVANEGLLEAP